MFENYLRVTLRNLFRRKTYTILNMGGMGIGLATGLLLLFWAHHEMSFDRFHTNAESLYRINANVSGFSTWTSTPQPIGTFVRNHLADVQLATRLQRSGRKELFKVGEKRFFEGQYGMVDSTFFNVFDFPLISGDALKPFVDAKSIVLSESTAKRFFGLDNAMGKTLEHGGMTFTVTGIMKDFPDNSSFVYDFVLNNQLRAQRCLEAPESCYAMPENDWGNYNSETWIVLAPGADPKQIATACTEELYRNNNSLDPGDFEFTLQPLSSLHLYKPDGTAGQIKLVRIFFAIAVLILLLAGVNYINLSTALAAQRVKEISVRKIIGAQRLHLFSQFWLETAVMLAGSLAIGLLLIELTRPYYQGITGKAIAIDRELWKVIGITFTAVWIMSGVYPALLLSSFRPALGLKGEWIAGKVGGFRKSLIVTQFTISAALLICAIVMRDQIAFMLDRKLGFDTTQVVELPARKFDKDYEFIKTEAAKLPGVYDVTGHNGGLFLGVNSTTDIEWDGKPKDVELTIQQLAIAPNFIDFFRIPLREGTGFDAQSDPSKHEVILNQSAVNAMSLEQPVGKHVTFHGEQHTIIGVVQDIHLMSMHESIQPGIYYLDPDVLGTIYVRSTPAEIPQLITAAEKLWQVHQPDLPFEYHFLDDRYVGLYEKEQQARSLFDGFSIIAFLISCLGLFGLALHSAERRTKEVGIRRVLGATTSGIVRLLSQDFIRLVLIALVIASPLAWWVMRDWLKDFAYHIDIGWRIFATTALLTLVVAVMTVGIQGMRAAFANPVHALRNE